MSQTTGTTPATTTTPPATVPASQVIPFPLPWANIPGCAPGCVPGGGMDALMKCYMDIKAAMAFIGKVMIDLINNDPAVAQAMIAAIEKSGSTLPLIGVTNGADAQPGQVGEWQMFSSSQSVLIPAGGTQTFNLSMGVLPAGDWNVQAYIAVQATLTTVSFGLNPQPAGITSDAGGSLALGPDADWQFIVGKPTRALLAVPTLLPTTVALVGTAGTTGTMEFYITCRRAR